ncbi:tripartite motif-containing protein 38 [Pelomyxa schiedti]|nr:tripartite motif-containing protein 38 [Pelomyxa schiedti]
MSGTSQSLTSIETSGLRMVSFRRDPLTKATVLPTLHTCMDGPQTRVPSIFPKEHLPLRPQGELRMAGVTTGVVVAAPPSTHQQQQRRCSVCRDPISEQPNASERGGRHPPVVVEPECGHVVCGDCSGAIVTFSRDIPQSSASREGPVTKRGSSARGGGGGVPGDGDRNSPTSAAALRVWCGVCGATRDATVRQLTPPPNKSPPSADSTTGPTAGSASGGGAVASCSRCAAMGLMGVSGKHWCKECTRAFGGGSPVLFCESCWPTAHWAPGLMSHVKCDPVSAVVDQAPERRMMCEKHRLQMDLFCESDSTFICPTCSFSSSHKGHNISTVEDLCSSKKSSVEAFVQKLTKLQTDLSLSAKSIEPVISNVKQIHSEFEEKVCREFSEMISRLQRRQEELLSLSRSIASSKTCELSQQLESITAGVMHIESFKSRFESILKTGDPSRIIESCDSMAVILRQIECKPEHLTPCVSATLSRCTDDIEPLKEKIPGLCYISTGPVLECIKEETTGVRSVTLCGQWAPQAMNQDIRVGVGESECTNVNVVTPGSVLTFTLPDCGVGCDLPVSLSVFGTPAHRPNDTRFSFRAPVIQNVTKVPRQGGVECTSVEVTHPHTEITCTVPPQPRDNNSNHATLVLTVAGQHVSSTPLIFETTWEWDTGCCGDLLVIPPHDKSMVRKPVSNPIQGQQSTVTATTQLSDPDRVYEWQFSISDLADGYHWVAYGLIQRPLDQNAGAPYCLMYAWSTNNDSWRIPGSTPKFKASGGEDVMFRYDARTLTLTATWPRHNNATATVNNIPRGLYPAVSIYSHNTVKITEN